MSNQMKMELYDEARAVKLDIFLSKQRLAFTIALDKCKAGTIPSVQKCDMQLFQATKGNNLIGVISREGMCIFETELKQFDCQKLF